MKKILYILGMAAAMSFASCQKDADVDALPKGDSVVAFTAECNAPITKVSGSNWEAGDAISVVACETYSNKCLYDNVKYITNESGSTVSFVPESECILYPEDGTALSFFAYYPYNESWSMNSGSSLFDISCQDSTAEGQAKADLLGSVNCANQQDGAGVQNLQFDHSFSKIKITLSNHEVLSSVENLEGFTASVSTKRWMFDAFARSAVESNEIKELKMLKTMEEDKAIFTLIVLPRDGGDDSEPSIDVKFTDGENIYIANIDTRSMENNYQYNFKATVGDQGFSLLALTADGVTDWDGQAEGSGSKDIEKVGSLCKIYTAQGLKMFADMVNGGQRALNGQLMNNIDLKGSEENQWSPIGSADYTYKGTFDGGGFEVSGLFINKPSLNAQGLFGRADGATIKNLGVDGSVVGNQYVGGIVGQSISFHIANCYNKATVSGERLVGGVVGCYGLNTFHPENRFVNCYNLGNVEDSGSSHWDFGGVVAVAYKSVSISSCYNSATVTVAGNEQGGGVVYKTYEGSTVKNCYFNNTLHSGKGIVSCGGEGDVKGYSTTYMQSEAFVIELNKAASDYNESNPAIKACAWKAVAGGYPTLDFGICYNEADEVYEIYTAAGLKAFADKVNAGELKINGKLMNDIALSGEWTPITEDRDDKNAYSGTFDGDGHSVTGLQVEGDVVGQGLFGACSNAIIKNLKVGGSVTSSNAHVAIIVGRAYFSAIENCETLAGSTVVATGGDGHGGIAGYVYDCSFTDCVNNASVSGTKFVGGIVGYTNDSSHVIGIVVKNCVNNGTIKASECTGGIVGTTAADTVTKISDCDNYGDVTATANGNYAGGIIAKIYNASSITNCSNAGTITATNKGDIAGSKSAETTIE